MKRRNGFWTFGLIRLICLCLVCVLSLTLLGFPSVKSAQAAGQVYYIDNVNGRDTNNGLSDSAAWQTLAKVNSFSFNPGSQILLKRGCEWQETLRPSTSGTETNPILFGAYGSGNKPLLNGLKQQRNVNAVDRQYLVFQDLDCRNGTSYGMYFEGTGSNLSGHIVVHNCTISGAASTGIEFLNSSYNLVEN
ncbi:MAG: hypothetical protein WCI75_15210, partial [candidate division NC10 bacterium]